MNEEKVKKPYRNYLWFILIITIVFAFVIIRTLYQTETRHFSGQEKNIFVIAALFGGLIGFTILYHIGKILFALISGFKVISINILLLTFKKQGDKWKFDIVFPEGFGGMIHVVPNKDYDKCKPILFHFGGLITSVVLAGLISLILTFVDPTHKLVFVSLTCSLAGIIVLLVNLLPLYTDSINDGFAIRLLLDKKNKKAYLDNLTQETSLKYQIGELKQIEYDDYNDTFQANSLIYQYYYYMDREDFYHAEKCCEKILEYRKFVFQDIVCLTEVNKLYFYVLRESSDKSYDYFYSLDKEYRNYALSTSNYETLKTGILLACKVEKTYDVYEHLLKSENKLKANYYPVRENAETKLIAKSKEITLSVFPDWEN